jgi:archaellum component FlaC
MADPKDMIVPMLQEMRKDLHEEFRDVREEMRGGFRKVNERLDDIESAQKSFRHALTADTMMSKFITGDFEERIDALEKKMNQLLKAKS